MDWLTEREEQAIFIVWPWLAAIFFIALLMTLATLKSWRRLWISLKSDGGKVPALFNFKIISVAFIALTLAAWFLKLDLIFVLIGIISLMFALSGSDLRSLGWWPLSWRNLFCGIGMGAGCVFLFWLFHSIILAVWIALKLPHEEQLAVKMFMESKGTLQIINFMLMACVMAPLLEEFGFRGALYPVLKSLFNGKIAMLITSALFAWVHYYWVGFLPLMMLGLLLTLVYEKTGSLWSCVGVHAGFNILNATQLLIFKIGMDQVE